MLTPEQLALSPVGRRILDEIAYYVVQVVSRSDDVSLWNRLRPRLADYLGEVPHALSGLDEGDFMGIVFQSAVEVSDLAYRYSGFVTIPAYETRSPNPSETDLEMAEQVLRHPATQWWSEPWKGRLQVLGGEEEIQGLRTRELGDFLQGKPKAIFFTSSAVEGLTSAYEVAAVSAEVDYWQFDDDFQYYGLDLAPSRPVFEIDSLEDWVRLCEFAPSNTHTGVVHPKWQRVAEKWSAVHLTTSGLITCQGVPVETSAGKALLHGWDIERTAWLEYAVKSWEILPKNMEDMRYWPTAIARMHGDSLNIEQLKGVDEERFRRTLPPDYR